MEPTNSPVPAAIAGFIDATNTADPDAFIAAFAPDAVLDDWGRTFAGRDRIQAWDRSDNIGVQAHFELLAIEPGTDPDTWIATLRVSGNGYNGTGPMTFRPRDGLIAGLTIS